MPRKAVTTGQLKAFDPGGLPPTTGPELFRHCSDEAEVCCPKRGIAQVHPDCGFSRQSESRGACCCAP